MRHQNSSNPFSESQSLPLNILQQSSLLTVLPLEIQTVDFETSDQKTISPIKLTMAQLDSQGEIRINITVPNSALTLVKLLGEGGFGSVYEGLYKGNPVAIKRLKIQHLTDKAVEELRNEAKIMFQLGLESKYIVPLKKICLESPYYSLVMELMPKGSLYDLLRNNQPLPLKIRLQIALDTALGLKDLHDYCILHRDLKSMNILLDDRLRAKLADFGLAKVKYETCSQSSVAKGTVLWMAPELFDDDPKMTIASDVYSFGMVLWELLTRKLPYAKAANQIVAARWIEKGKKEDIPGDCPLELKVIIESCWETLPTKRLTAVQIVEQLKPLVTTEEQKQPSSSSISSQKENLHELEMHKLKAEMEQKMAQMKLAYEQQLDIAAEEKQQKDKEIERLKQDHQAELKRIQKESKLKPLSSQSISTPSELVQIPVMSKNIQQTFMPMPKSLISAGELQLQDQLLAACKRGDEKEVAALLKRGAKPDIPNAKGEQPLGAAVWSMCPDIVNILLKQSNSVASMTWSECEEHNLKHYKEVFIIPAFDPKTYKEWNQFLKKMDSNLFISTFHLKMIDEQWHDNDTSSWDHLKRYSSEKRSRGFSELLIMPKAKAGCSNTEVGYVNFRTQIKQKLESAKHPTVGVGV
jgi:serine/threonine protein kinase